MCLCWNPPLFPLWGRAREQPPTLGQQEGGGPGGGAFTAWEGRRGDVPHAPGPSWPALSFYSSPIMKEKYIQDSFICGLLVALKKYYPHLCSQSKGGNRHWVSDCFQWCCGGTDFSKEPSFILGHVSAGPDFFMSPGSSARSMFCVSRVILNVKCIWLFYWDTKKGPGLQKGVKRGGK